MGFVNPPGDRGYFMRLSPPPRLQGCNAFFEAKQFAPYKVLTGTGSNMGCNAFFEAKQFAPACQRSRVDLLAAN
jgi:hypothetical protein